MRLRRNSEEHSPGLLSLAEHALVIRWRFGDRKLSPPGQEESRHPKAAPPGHANVGYFRQPFNLTGQPAASIPCGLTPDNLPVGLQVVAPLGGAAISKVWPFGLRN
jgi:hypothetical protein